MWEQEARPSHSQVQGTTFEILDPKPKAVLIHTPRSFPRCPTSQRIHCPDVTFGHLSKTFRSSSPPWVDSVYSRGLTGECISITVAFPPASDLFEEGEKRWRGKRRKSTETKPSSKSKSPLPTTQELAVPNIPLNTKSICPDSRVLPEESHHFTHLFKKGRKENAFYHLSAV